MDKSDLAKLILQSLAEGVYDGIKYSAECKGSLWGIEIEDGIPYKTTPCSSKTLNSNAETEHNSWIRRVPWKSAAKSLAFFGKYGYLPVFDKFPEIKQFYDENKNSK